MAGDRNVIELVGEARELAAAASGRAGVSVRVLGATGELAELAHLLGRVWPQPGGGDPLHLDLLRAVDLAGGYLAGAFDAAGAMVGGSVAFAALTEPVSLHSHATGVDEGRIASGVGYALKLDQRAWALERGVRRIAWTFDPLVRRNAHFNLSRLGATTDGYLKDIYGPMEDSRNAGDETDRLHVVWELDAPAVSAALATGTPLVAEAGPAMAVAARDGEPVVDAAAAEGSGFGVAVPADVESLRRRDPELALRWRRAVRTAMAPALAAGGRVLGLDPGGAYVVSRGAGS